MTVVDIPREWKPLGTGEEEIDYCVYHLLASGTTASAVLTFFTGTRAANGLAVTNMEQAGQFPSATRFLVKEIQLLTDVNAAAGDSADVLDAAALELYVANKLMYSAPAPVFATNVTPSYTTTATIGSAVNMIKFELDRGIVINGGTPFRAEMLIGKTAVSASTDLTVLLRGHLIRPIS